MSIKYLLLTDELREILEQPNNPDEVWDFSSDHSVKVPTWSLDICEICKRQKIKKTRNNVQVELELIKKNFVIDWAEYEGHRKIFTFSRKSGLQIDVPQNIPTYDVYRQWNNRFSSLKKINISSNEFKEIW